MYRKIVKKHLLLLQIVALISVSMTCCASNWKTEASQTGTDNENNILQRSEKTVKITCGDAEATFQLYDTQAAQEFYDQLPLTLETENFRSAQWMFYPPEKLNVTELEAYHDGKKGELSYYEPWGDAFILYEDFYAGDEMHRLGICVSGIDTLAEMSGTILVEQDTEPMESMQIQVDVNGVTLTALLENNSSAQALYDKLADGSITIRMSDYANFEKVGNLGFRLPVNDTQITTKAGDIILYQGNQLVFYYDTNSWNFTRLGEFQNVSQKELKELFGAGGITAVLSR
ncbi:MAG: hypothetical protein LIO92_12665 [Clostridiales bacterium]|nr:hypothetical protein [Clostridiales bacterium]